MGFIVVFGRAFTKPLFYKSKRGDTSFDTLRSPKPPLLEEGHTNRTLALQLSGKYWLRCSHRAVAVTQAYCCGHASLCGHAGLLRSRKPLRPRRPTENWTWQMSSSGGSRRADPPKMVPRVGRLNCQDYPTGSSENITEGAHGSTNYRECSSWNWTCKT